jgi:fructose-1,6-bisphosphatase I
MQVQADGDRNVLHDGQRQVCAGYALYGPSILVLTDGSGLPVSPVIRALVIFG